MMRMSKKVTAPRPCIHRSNGTKGHNKAQLLATIGSSMTTTTLYSNPSVFSLSYSSAHRWQDLQFGRERCRRKTTIPNHFKRKGKIRLPLLH
ncbi:Hypothetical protein NTJ_10628 [Nesidiocoris tenuis]|uniref:Uncharacterized protein n=1 Tax=Nesidiocoris tenuis TaxID=355587 RepID=A0ABN7B2K9_9HEMI|nr:Hypothetical protein NTJ_10628 [Nesidiocoris tenuis]